MRWDIDAKYDDALGPLFALINRALWLQGYRD
ncbi:hypothetical protein AGROH133_10963 [Agrobacterium tumefaciens]|nr:hypothetical protein AGROH133_10963 [Agrobacterium tumefaciens]